MRMVPRLHGYNFANIISSKLKPAACKKVKASCYTIFTFLTRGREVGKLEII